MFTTSCESQFISKLKVLKKITYDCETQGADIQATHLEYWNQGMESHVKEYSFWDFSGIPVVKNPPSKAGVSGSNPDQGTKIPHAVGQLSHN